MKELPHVHTVSKWPKMATGSKVVYRLYHAVFNNMNNKMDERTKFSAVEDEYIIEIYCTA